MFTHRTIATLLGIFLFLAILPLPYGYYTFLRLIVFVGGLFLAHQLHGEKLYNWSVIVVGMAILFNPLIPVYLSREVWLPIDIVGAVIFFFVANKSEKTVKQN